MSTSSGTRGPYAKTAAKRAAIARAAYEVVREVGHEQLTTAAVAERADMSERTMLYHFPTRDHLLVAALEHFDTVVMGAELFTELLEGSDARKALLLASPPPTAAESEQVITELVNTSISDKARLRLYCYLAGQAQVPGSAAHEHFVRHYEEAITGFTLLMQSFQNTGQARTDRSPQTLARRFLAAWDGLQQQWVVTEDFDLGAEILEAFNDAVGRDLLRTRAAVRAVLEDIAPTTPSAQKTQ
ncbi:helix-turn-helix domain-containing protein [Actinomyces sp. MRS3W]|uniref:helix-turn-helix domain-containing protein n=1 Tax=Actinomyces sp. MRS3W TaxID=2800796 RepID=UPI0028FD5388|nr:helix-turn-helix domain-containing protein [Actinomyces sp. MRS3W]MDU0348927.1 helix-turn-helix domain-containing protein [Actinomyces sp. MRS3W]